MNSRISLPVSATEWAVSAHSAAEPVSTPAAPLATAMSRLARTATSTVRVLASPGSSRSCMIASLARQRIDGSADGCAGHPAMLPARSATFTGMRIARFAHGSGMSFGVVEGEVGAGPDALTIAEIDSHPFGQLRFTSQRWALADVRLLSPILPSKVVCVGRNYAEHAAELGNEVPK